MRAYSTFSVDLFPQPDDKVRPASPERREAVGIAAFARVKHNPRP